MTHPATSKTADALVAESSAMIVKVLSKQMRAVLEQMEEEWRKENYRANCLYGFVVTVLVYGQRGTIDQQGLMVLAKEYCEKYAENCAAPPAVSDSPKGKCVCWYGSLNFLCKSEFKPGHHVNQCGNEIGTAYAPMRCGHSRACHPSQAEGV